MSKIIEFLEKLGQDADLRYATTAELEAALLRADVDPSERAAILQKDQRLLESLLHASSNVCCMVAKPLREDDEEEEVEEEVEDDKKEKAENLTPQTSPVRRAA